MKDFFSNRFLFIVPILLLFCFAHSSSAAVLQFTGGETGTLVENAFSGNISATTTAVKHGSYSYRANPTGSAVGSISMRPAAPGGDIQTSPGSDFGAITSLYTSSWIRVDTFPSSGAETIIRGTNTSNATMFFIRLNSDRTLTIFNNSSVALATTTATFSPSTWHYINLRVDASASGAYEMKIDGTTVLSGTGNFSGTWRAITLGKAVNVNGNSMDMYLDDIVVDSSSYGTSGQQVAALMPNAAGTYSSWSTPAFSRVNERPNDGNNTYAESAGDGTKVSWNLADASSAGISGSINAVKGLIVTRESVAATTGIQVLSISGSTEATTTSFDGSTSFVGLEKLHTSDPNTSSAWTLSGVDSYQVGALAASQAATTLRVTQASAQILFTPSTDSVPPVISSVASSTLPTTATITWNTDEPSTSVVDYGLTTSYGSASTSAALVTSHSVMLSGLSQGTSYHFRISSADATGNIATSSDYILTTSVLDATPPNISAIASSTSAAAATISWTTDEAADSKVVYGTSAGTYTLSTSSAAFVTSHSLSISSLSLQTNYYFRVVSKDAQGNTSTSSERVFTTGAFGLNDNLVGYYTFEAGDGTDSSGSGNTGTLVNSPAVVSGKSSANALSFAGTSKYVNLGPFSAIKNVGAITASAWVKYDVLLSNADEVILENSTASTDRDIILTRYRNSVSCLVRTSSNVTATKTFTNDSGIWHLVTCVYDGSNVIVYVDGAAGTPVAQTGNTMNAAGNLVISTDTAGPTSNTIDDVRIYNRALSSSEIVNLYNYAVNDIYPPSISSVSTSTTATTSLITWITDEPATSQIEYGLSSSYTASSTLIAATTTSHSVTLAGLAPNTTYHYRIRSIDSSGNLATTSDQTFQTATAYTLTINKIGSGTVVGRGISCGNDCSEIFAPSATTTLTAYPDSGYVFTGWSGGGCSGTGNCSITVSASTTVTATFQQGGSVYTGNTITHNSGGVDFIWEFNCGGRACKYGQFVTGDYWVVPINDLDQNTSVVTFTAISPPGTKNGAEVNPVVDDLQGLMDLYPSRYSASRNIMTQLPYNASPNSSIFKAYVLATTTATNTPYREDAHCRQMPGCIASDDVLTVLGSIPPDNGLSVFRPPFYGTSKPLYSANDVDLDRLPSLDIVSDTFSGNYSDTVARIAGTWSVPQYEMVTPPGSSGSIGDFFRDMSPVYAMSDYAAYQAGAYHGDTLSVFGTEPVSQKAPAVYALIQRGIDKYAMFKGGVAFGAGAGQRLGKKPPVAFLAAMLDDPVLLADVRSIAASSTLEEGDYFQEDSQIKAGLGGQPIWGNGSENEATYWLRYFSSWKAVHNLPNGGHDSNGAEEDPYDYIDGPPGGPIIEADGTGAGRDYQYVSSPYHEQFAFLQLMMPWYKYADNDPQIIQYMDRIYDGYKVPGFSGGVWNLPDPVAGPDSREVTTCDPRDPSTCLYYKVTWGPDPANPGQALLHSANPSTTQNGRWPEYHGYDAGEFLMGGDFDDLHDNMRECLDPDDNSYGTGDCSGMGPEAVADDEEPVLAEVTPISTPTADATPSYTFSSTEAGTIAYGGSCSSVTTSASAGNNTVTFSSLSNGTYSNCTITVTDSSSNASAPLSVSTFTVNAAGPDATPPVISSVASSTSQTSSIITWTTDESATSTVEYGANTSYGTASTSASFVTSHSITITGLSAGTQYHFRVSSTDAAGNRAVSADYVFTTSSAPDTVPPDISDVEASPSDVNASITWDTDEAANSVVAYGTSTGTYFENQAAAPLVTTHLINLTGLTASTTYYYVVSSTDASGNAATSSEYSFVTDDAPDTAEPTLSEVTPVPTPATDTTPSYTFSSDEAGTITYGGSCSSGSTSAISGNNTITFDALAPGTYSDCTITVTDASNNESDELEVSAFTIEAPVVTPGPEEEEEESRPRNRSGGSSRSRSDDKDDEKESEAADSAAEQSAAAQDEGCVPGNAFSTTSGRACASSASAAAQPDSGCLPGNLFSIVTGKSCGASGMTLAPVTVPAPSSALFLRDLTIGSQGEDVRALQAYLNAHGYVLAPAGVGSPGFETDLFGGLTRAALARFQAANGIAPAAGYFGPLTRQAMQQSSI